MRSGSGRNEDERSKAAHEYTLGNSENGISGEAPNVELTGAARLYRAASSD